MMIGTPLSARMSAADLDAVHARQHEVEQHEIGPHGAEELEGLAAVGGELGSNPSPRRTMPIISEIAVSSSTTRMRAFIDLAGSTGHPELGCGSFSTRVVEVCKHAEELPAAAWKDDRDREPAAGGVRRPLPRPPDRCSRRRSRRPSRVPPPSAPPGIRRSAPFGPPAPRPAGRRRRSPGSSRFGR